MKKIILRSLLVLFLLNRYAKLLPYPGVNTVCSDQQRAFNYLLIIQLQYGLPWRYI